MIEHFRQMRLLGANVVRVHFSSPGLWMRRTGPMRRRSNALAGSSSWRRTRDCTSISRGWPVTASKTYHWYSALGETKRWEAQARFSEAIAGHYAASPAIFCYDLMNEPIVPGGTRKPGDWLTGELGGFNYCQFISLDQAGRPAPGYRAPLGH